MVSGGVDAGVVPDSLRSYLPAVYGEARGVERDVFTGTAGKAEGEDETAHFCIAATATSPLELR